MGLLRAGDGLSSKGSDQLDQTKRYFFAGKLLLSMGVVLLALTPLIVMGLRKLLDTAESAEAGASFCDSHALHATLLDVRRGPERPL